MPVAKTNSEPRSLGALEPWRFQIPRISAEKKADLTRFVHILLAPEGVSGPFQ